MSSTDVSMQTAKVDGGGSVMVWACTGLLQTELILSAHDT